MTAVNVRELRNHGGDVLQRVTEGETVIVERAGHPVAKLVPIPRNRASARELVERRRRLQTVDPDALRADIDDLLNTSL